MQSLQLFKCKSHIDGLVQERLNSIANALELHISCTNQLLTHWSYIFLAQTHWFVDMRPKLVITVPYIEYDKFCLDKKENASFMKSKVNFILKQINVT